ncbi:MAG: Hint domain-containing protein [Paracoccaceae bacterium]
MVAAAELPININASAMLMAQTIFGNGVTVVNASYTGDSRSSGIYSNGDTVSPGVTPSDTGVILSTGYAQDFTNSASSSGPWWNPTPAQSNQNTNTSTNTSGVNGNADFNAIAGTRTYDASWLDVDFIPTGDVMTMQFVFSSEEYPEYAASIYNDVVGVWVNGNHVPMSVGSGDPSVGNINANNNFNLFVDNTNDQYNTEMDGFTVTMTLTIPVVSGEVNSIRIGIADVADSSYDSSLLIAGDSVQTTLVAMDDNSDIFIGATKNLDVLANDLNSTGGTLTITHVNGVAVNVGDSVLVATGQTVTLLADGTFDVTTDSDEEAVTFTYGIESSTGDTDVGFVTLNTIPCFVAGTMIMTPSGERPVESLEPGALVMTHDDGPQPVRWLGRRTVAAQGNFAPIRIRAGALGDGHRELMLSPQHRVLIRNHMADLLFGDAEVLVAAKDLVNDLTIRPVEGGEVEYVHVLFDRHQVIYAEGLPTESFLPGPAVMNQFERETLDEICTIFPELDPDTGAGYSPAARRMLKAFEAQILVREQMVA